MSIELPNLDDRSFPDLLAEIRQRISASTPEWTDLSPHDPGIVLLEIFAHLTESLLYRFNRIPEKSYLAFLNLLGVQQHPPTAAKAVLEFRRDRREGPITIPAGTRVGGGSGPDAPVFFTEATVTLDAGTDAVTVGAHACEVVEAELLGESTGRPGQVFRVARPPMTSSGEPVDLLVGVETPADQLAENAPARDWEGTTFEIWQPVWTFAGHPADARVYVVDRGQGTVTFAPALGTRGETLAAVPPLGREVRAWYRTGGGPAGNVGAGTITEIRDAVPGVKVSNPERSFGGRAMEPVGDVVKRGPYEFLSARRAVTAADFQLLATQSSGGVSRARALTRAEMWSFAKPGEVEVVLVPHVPVEAMPEGRLPIDVLESHQTDEALAATARRLDERRPLGTRCIARWANYKPVAVRARVVVGREEDAALVRRRVLDRLYDTIRPVGGDGSSRGWPFGQALRPSNIYRLLEHAEPGVRWVDNVSFTLDAAPDGEVSAVAVDGYQDRTWYAGQGETMFRSLNDGEGWEPVGVFPNEQVWAVEPYPAAVRPGLVGRPGWVAMVSRLPEGARSAIYVSEDLGETWRKVTELDVRATDVAWAGRDGSTGLLVSTDRGLFELPLPTGAAQPVSVDPSDPDRGFYKVVSFVSERGEQAVALAAQAEAGVYLSTAGGRAGTFAPIGLRGEDTRALAVEIDGPATWLWAGLGEINPDAPGNGCRRARLFEREVRWEAVSDGWLGGTCWDITFSTEVALAATGSGGVIRGPRAGRQGAWEHVDVNAGLPLRDRPRFEPVMAVAAHSQRPLVFAAGPRGVYLSGDEGRRWWAGGGRETTGTVTIPDSWLLCSAEHDIEVVTEDATRRD